jgi:hypothetical protein
MLETNIFNALSPLVGARVYPDIAPVGTTLPYITYQQVGGKPVNFLGAESSDKKNARMQINVWSASRLQAALISRSVEDYLVLTPLFGSVEGGSIASYEPRLKLYGTMQDFSFWS